MFLSPPYSFPLLEQATRPKVGRRRRRMYLMATVIMFATERSRSLENYSKEWFSCLLFFLPFFYFFYYFYYFFFLCLLILLFNSHLIGLHPIASYVITFCKYSFSICLSLSHPLFFTSTYIISIK